MFQNTGISIPTWVSPCLERPGYHTSASRSFRQPVCLPARPQNYPPPGRFSQDAMYPQNEGTFPSFLPERQSTRLPSWTPWHPRPQNLPFLGYLCGGDPLCHMYGNDLMASADSQSYPQKRKRVRTTFSVEQLKKLEKRFHGNHYIVGDERLKTSRDLNLSEAQVKVWFQNRRIKFKREKELEHLGLKQKRKGEHHVKRWQVVTRNFDPDYQELFCASNRKQSGMEC